MGIVVCITGCWIVKRGGTIFFCICVYFSHDRKFGVYKRSNGIFNECCFKFSSESPRCQIMQPSITYFLEKCGCNNISLLRFNCTILPTLLSRLHKKSFQVDRLTCVMYKMSFLSLLGSCFWSLVVRSSKNWFLCWIIFHFCLITL